MSPGADASNAASREALRAEHDALAERLAVRTSIDAARRAFTLVFVGLIAVGLTAKLAWDRWGALRPGVVRRAHVGRPLFLYVAGTAAVVLLLLSIRSFLAARRLMQDEDARFARVRELRGILGLDR
jgi:hypothetical protein